MLSRKHRIARWNFELECDESPFCLMSSNKYVWSSVIAELLLFDGGKIFCKEV